MRVHGKLVIVPNKSDGNCITTAFRWCLRMADPIPLLTCLLMFAVHVNACATALILHCNVASPIFSRLSLSLPRYLYTQIYIHGRLFDRRCLETLSLLLCSAREWKINYASLFECNRDWCIIVLRYLVLMFSSSLDSSRLEELKTLEGIIYGKKKEMPDKKM